MESAWRRVTLVSVWEQHSYDLNTELVNLNAHTLEYHELRRIDIEKMEATGDQHKAWSLCGSSHKDNRLHLPVNESTSHKAKSQDRGWETPGKQPQWNHPWTNGLHVMIT